MRNPVRPNRALIVLLACCDSADSGGAHRRGLGWHLRPVVFVLLTDDNIASVLWVAALVNTACIAAPRCPFGLAIMTKIWIRMVLLPVSSPDSCSAVCSSISMWVPQRFLMALILDPPLKMMRRGKTRTRRHLCALAWWSPSPTRRRQCELWVNAALWCSWQSWSSSQQTEQAGAWSGLASCWGNTLQKAGKRDADILFSEACCWPWSSSC